MNRAHLTRPDAAHARKVPAMKYFLDTIPQPKHPLTGKVVTVKRSGRGFERAVFLGLVSGLVSVKVGDETVSVEPRRVRGYFRAKAVERLNSIRSARKSGGMRGDGASEVEALHVTLGKPPRPSGSRKPKATAKKAAPKKAIKATAKKATAKKVTRRAPPKVATRKPATVISISARRKAGAR